MTTIDVVLTVLSTLGVGTAIVAGLRYLVRKYVDGYFAKKEREQAYELDKLLEDHRQKLAVATVSAEHSLQRQLEEFNLYTRKRHAAYPVLLGAFIAWKDAFNDGIREGKPVQLVLDSADVREKYADWYQKWRDNELFLSHEVRSLVAQAVEKLRYYEELAQSGARDPVVMGAQRQIIALAISNLRSRMQLELEGRADSASIAISQSATPALADGSGRA